MAIIADIEYVTNVCKLGMGRECCSYLLAGPDGMECAKDPGNESIKRTIDTRRLANSMGSMGDNCPGYGNRAEAPLEMA